MLYFRHTKQTSKNVANTTFKENYTHAFDLRIRQHIYKDKRAKRHFKEIFSSKNKIRHGALVQYFKFLAGFEKVAKAFPNSDKNNS